MRLGRFVDREAGDETSGAHQNYRGIRDFLGPVVLGLRGKVVTQVQIFQGHLDCLDQALPVGNHKPPFAGENGEQHIQQPVDGKDPGKEEVIAEPLGHMVGRVHRLPEPMGKEAHQGEGSHADPVNHGPDLSGPPSARCGAALASGGLAHVVQSARFVTFQPWRGPRFPRRPSQSLVGPITLSEVDIAHAYDARKSTAVKQEPPAQMQ